MRRISGLVRCLLVCAMGCESTVTDDPTDPTFDAAVAMDGSSTTTKDAPTTPNKDAPSGTPDAAGGTKDAPKGTPDAMVATKDAPTGGTPDAKVGGTPDAPVTTTPDAPITSTPDAPIDITPDGPVTITPDAAVNTPDASADTPDANTGPAPTNDKCANATPITFSGAVTTIEATTIGATADMTGSCLASSSPDVFFSFHIATRELFYADTFGTDWNTSLFLATDCSHPFVDSTTTGDAVCNDDSCSTSQSQVVAVLLPGTYYLILSGGEGAASIHIEHVSVGSGPVAPLPAGVTQQQATTSQYASISEECQTGGGESAHWWKTCPDSTGGTFAASTCGLASFDTTLKMDVPREGYSICFEDDDTETCHFETTVIHDIPSGPGLNVLGVRGAHQADHGDYAVMVSRP